MVGLSTRTTRNPTQDGRCGTSAATACGIAIQGNLSMKDATYQVDYKSQNLILVNNTQIIPNIAEYYSRTCRSADPFQSLLSAHMLHSLGRSIRRVLKPERQFQLPCCSGCDPPRTSNFLLLDAAWTLTACALTRVPAPREGAVNNTQTLSQCANLRCRKVRTSTGPSCARTKLKN